jgi:hypothetical protein
MATTSSQKYAPSAFVESVGRKEETEQTTINSAAGQVLSNGNFNKLFSPINTANIDTEGLNKVDKEVKAAYKYGFIDIIPTASAPAKNAAIGCKAPAEYATSNNVNMTRLDGGYHTFNTCSNKATMANKKYFACVKPLPAAGVKDPALYECYAGNDPIMNASTGQTASSYYDYVVCWSIGPTLKTFGVSANVGDIIITADNIASIGLKQNQASNTVTNYTYGNTGTYLPPNTFVSLRTYVFDLDQVSVAGGFMNGGYIGRDIPINMVSLVSGTNDTYIVGVRDGPYTKMVKIQLAIGGSKLYPSLPNDGSLYAKALEVKYTGLFRFVRITAPCNGDNWLQIAELQVFDENGNNVAKGKRVYARDNYPWYSTPANAVSGKTAPMPYPYIYHSGNPCNPWWMVDLGQDVNITKIVYFNRVDCCQGRTNGALLDCMGVNHELMFRASMNGDMIQTFNVPPSSTTDLNAMWNKGVPTNLVGDGTTPGYGVKGFTVKVDPVALGRGPNGYAYQQNTAIPTGQPIYKTLNGIEPDSCRVACDNDPNCVRYTTSGTTVVNSETDPTWLGCYRDSPERALATFTRVVKNLEECRKEAQYRNMPMMGLQYGGYCFVTNDESPGTGYARYGKDGGYCTPSHMGGAWQNNVFKRNFSSKTVTNCNLYGANSSGSQTSDGATLSVRNKTSAPVNNTILNLTNNALKLDLSQCGNNACKFRLELGTDGNLKLYKLASANGTVSSSSTGEVVWDLFSSDSAVADKIKSIAPITQLDWKNAFNNGSNNIISAGESLPATKKQVISSNGQFKLEIVNGYLQLKAAVYGCFANDYSNSNATMYTNAVSNGPQPFYIYQTDLSHPKLGNMYYLTEGGNGKGLKQIDRKSALIQNSSSYSKVEGNYKPLNDVDPTISTVANATECQAKCNVLPNCKYVYMKNETQCGLGNQITPAFTVSSDPTEKYDLYLRQGVLDTGNVKSTIGMDPKVKLIPNPQSGTFKTQFLGEPITDPSQVGLMSIPPAKEILSVQERLRGPDVPLKPVATPVATPITNNPMSNYGSAPKIGTDNTKSVSSILGSFFSQEGFDSHGWTDPTDNCGKDPKIPGCYAGIMYGQIKPLQQISNDYSKQLIKMSNTYADISGNIGKYQNLHKDLSNDPKYDFAGDQPIVFSGNTDLLTEMKNDSKQLALQTNNMYIAGSILTTTLLVSAIYLGRP